MLLPPLLLLLLLLSYVFQVLQGRRRRCQEDPGRRPLFPVGPAHPLRCQVCAVLPFDCTALSVLSLTALQAVQ
jgi:hypothetical protein